MGWEVNPYNNNYFLGLSNRLNVRVDYELLVLASFFTGKVDWTKSKSPNKNMGRKLVKSWRDMAHPDIYSYHISDGYNISTV